MKVIGGKMFDNLDKLSYYEDIYKAAKNDDKNSFRDLFLKLHTNDQIEVLDLLYPENKAKITGFLSPEEFAEIFDMLEIEEQDDAMNYLPADYLTSTLHYVSDDNVTDFLLSLEQDKRQILLERMAIPDRIAIEKLLQHDESTAGSIMTTEMITVSENDSPKAVIEKMRDIGRQAEMIYYIYVLNESGHLTGVLSLRDLILSPENEKVKNIMNPQISSVLVTDDQEDVAKLIQDYDLLAIPVVTMDNILVGIVTVDDIMDVLQDEATEDIHKLAGINHDSGDDSASGDSILRMTRTRLPWIIILIFMGLISAQLIGYFEDTISQVVLLAAFMPIIMDTAGNVGTQSLAVSVRRITTGDDSEPFLTLLWKEFASGMLMGVASGIAISLIAAVLYGNWALTVVVGLSLLFTISISTVVGYVVPVIFTKFNIDPAVASGPFITTINDTVGLVTYFSIATYLLEHL